MNLTEAERATVVNALRVAALTYHADAEQMRSIHMPRFAEQFDNQQVEADRLSDYIENED